MSNSHKSQITIDVELDVNRVPEKINWNATDGGISNEAAKAIMLGVWDEKTKNTLRIDLWTKDMLMDEMKQFYHQTILSLADSFERATDEKNMAADMRDFAAHFADKLDLIKK
ncbi:gliding motility protein GldC [Phaeocystidibacter luteus]|uniref:Gliding motility protein GldC n=1 Tax=Phaeocystidibacter luteus TaxID=911197 RepID=A0A6N6RI77_9FLAO|nr:gliding motility protein GldC [Phaeocystidibacter luteus]KAB2813667.1 gliding motility protein GldC [Phaeocystidibacter luteus]